MKIPKLEDLQKAKTSDPFQKKVTEIKGRTLDVVRKTFSLGRGDLEHVNAVAVSMSQRQGKVVNASEALRAIIRRDKDKVEGQ